MSFRRARTDDQRDQRRRTILDTAAAMLTEMPVAKLSLNELSRRVGLAKSNVLRYFESREAVLLELLSMELQGWVGALDLSAISPYIDAIARADAIASKITTSLASRVVLCDLVSAQATVLERNVSTGVVLRHKRAVGACVQRFSDLIIERVPELEADDVYQIIATTLLMTSAAWPHSQPSEALLAAYAEDPEISAHHTEFTDFMKRSVGLTISGLLARRAAASVEKAEL